MADRREARMRLLCSHEWEKTETEPHNTYFDYSGVKVGVFACRCRICGRMRNRKFMGRWFYG